MRDDIDTRMLFRDLGGRPFPVAPRGPGREPDGVTLFSLTGAARRYRMSEDRLRAIYWRTRGLPFQSWAFERAVEAFDLRDACLSVARELESIELLAAGDVAARVREARRALLVAVRRKEIDIRQELAELGAH